MTLTIKAAIIGVVGVVIGAVVSPLVAPFVDPNDPPKADINASPLYGPAPLVVTVNAGSSSDPDGDQLQYVWEVNGKQIAKNVTAFIHKFPSPGKYDLALILSDGEVIRRNSVKVEVVAPPPAPPTVIVPRVRVILLKLVVHNDGDSGFEGEGDFVWTFVVNGQTVGAQNSEINLGSGSIIDLNYHIDLELSPDTPINITGNVIDKDDGASGSDDRISYSILINLQQLRFGEDRSDRPANGGDPDVELVYRVDQL